MTLRARLLLALAALLGLALLVSGGLVVGITRASLIEQLDSDLRNTRDIDVGLGGPPGGPDATGHRFALLVYAADGSQVGAYPAGFGYAPDPLPDLPTGLSGLTVGTISDGRSSDGSVGYRLLPLQAPNGVTVVVGAPLREVDAATGVLVRTLLLVGAAVLAALLIVGWLLLRRGLRPLEQMTETADRISAGDLSQRVSASVDESEVGRLSTAFNAMLDQIERSFDSQQQALTAKERSESQLRRFLADASHELRTPLTSLRGYADLYAAGGLADQAALELAMRRIGTESRRMAALVEDMLLLARLDQGRPLGSEPVDLGRLAEDAVADARAVEPGRPLQSSITPAVWVYGDEDRLRQLIGNLLANVAVHVPPDAPVEVSLTAAGERACLTVADHGPGIPGEHAGQIFDRFYRGDAGRTRERGGTGLGLSIAHAIASAHAGTLEYSDTPGGGATFTLCLPLAVPPAPASDEHENTGGPRRKPTGASLADS